MCYERRRAEACVDESAHHALENAGGREIVGKKEGEQKGSARGSVHWGCYYATALDIEVDPQRCCLVKFVYGNSTAGGVDSIIE